MTDLIKTAERVWQAYLGWGPVDDGTLQGEEFEAALGALREATTLAVCDNKNNKGDHMNKIFTRDDLENMENWRATFRHIIAHASPLDRVVCLMKNPPGESGYFWKMPGMMSVEKMDIEHLQDSLIEQRLELVHGHLPRGVKTLQQINRQKKMRITKGKKRRHLAMS